MYFLHLAYAARTVLVSDKEKWQNLIPRSLRNKEKDGLGINTATRRRAQWAADAVEAVPRSGDGQHGIQRGDLRGTSSAGFRWGFPRTWSLQNITEFPAKHALKEKKPSCVTCSFFLFALAIETSTALIISVAASAAALGQRLSVTSRLGFAWKR